MCGAVHRYDFNEPMLEAVVAAHRADAANDGGEELLVVAMLFLQVCVEHQFA